ncbi:UDP-2,3-diacylglucosamine diphosphatase [hydrothermal vent metagenome]|uniref:UDP-2,3-diacylglucosamine diphosphatase n=1 Tax=hydrothermal vent metagenome TaxID=652676 RepID=A0A3B0X5H6_9ZZZZ
MTKHLFISDLHLAPERPDIIQLFIQFLNNQAAQAQSLYILGDLVEYWLGDDDKADGLNAAFDTMKELAEKGLKIYVMHGNRDFLMGEQFAQRCGCELIHEPYIANLNNTPILLLHGDILCTDDLRYQELRKMLRNPAWQTEFLSKPIEEREQMAQALRKQSKEETQLKNTDIMDVNARAVENAFIDNKVTLMIHGHTHRPDIHKLKINNKAATRIVLGDWYSQGSVLELNSADDYKLHRFNS